MDDRHRLRRVAPHDERGVAEDVEVPEGVVLVGRAVEVHHPAGAVVQKPADGLLLLVDEQIDRFVHCCLWGRVLERVRARVDRDRPRGIPCHAVGRS